MFYNGILHHNILHLILGRLCWSVPCGRFQHRKSLLSTSAITRSKTPCSKSGIWKYEAWTAVRNSSFGKSKRFLWKWTVSNSKQLEKTSGSEIKSTSRDRLNDRLDRIIAKLEDRDIKLRLVFKFISRILVMCLQNVFVIEKSLQYARFIIVCPI